MGYACPVCETPQRDGEHLAHHLAFTAMLHGDDHEAWLDEHVPAWSERDPAGLAADVTTHAADAEYHEVFEDTVDRGRPDIGGRGQGGHDAHGHARGIDTELANADPETAAAIAEARELTRQLLEDDPTDTTREDEEVDGDDADKGDLNADDADVTDDPSA